jgi:hypothetical protein
MFVEAARAWAARLLAGPARDDGERIGQAFEEALARPPKPQERASLVTFLARTRAEYEARPGDAARLTATGSSLLSAAQPEYALRESSRLAAWTNLCRVLLSLHESFTRF